MVVGGLEGVGGRASTVEGEDVVDDLGWVLVCGVCVCVCLCVYVRRDKFIKLETYMIMEISVVEEDMVILEKKKHPQKNVSQNPPFLPKSTQ